MTKVIAIDANGVLLDPGAKVRALMEVTGAVFTPYHFDHFSGRASAKKWLDIVDDQYDCAMNLLYGTDRFFEFTTLMPGVEEALSRLVDSGWAITVVSSCKGLTEQRLWRLCNYFRLPISEVITSVNSKTDYYALCDVAIDDEVRHLQPLLAHPDTTPILMLPPKNGTGSGVLGVSPKLNRRIRPAFGWDNALKHIPMALAA